MRKIEMENVKMKKQTYQQQKIHGETINRVSNKDKHQTNNQKLLRLKSGILDQTRRRPRRLDEDVGFQ